MAPIHATSTGVPRTQLDDPRLEKLLQDLSQKGDQPSLGDISTLLQPFHQKWHFEEQVRGVDAEFRMDSTQTQRTRMSHPNLTTRSFLTGGSTRMDPSAE